MSGRTYTELLSIPVQEYSDSPTTRSYTLWRLYNEYLEKLVNGSIKIGGEVSGDYRGYDIVYSGSRLKTYGIGFRESQPLNIINPLRDRYTLLHYMLMDRRSYRVELSGGVYRILSVIPVEKRIIPQHLVLRVSGETSIYLDILSGDSRSYRSFFTEIDVEPHARLNLVLYVEDTPNAPSLIDLGLRIGDGSKVNMVYVARPGRMTRLLSTAIIEGGDVELHSRGIVLSMNDSRIDNIANYVVKGSGSYIKHLFTGLGLDRSVMAQRGLGRIAYGAESSSIEYYSEALPLTPSAKTYLQPRLEIDTGNVSIAKHAARIKHILPEQVFYMETRGIPGEYARRMLIRGFLLQEVYDRNVADRVDKLLDRCLSKNYY